MIVLDASSEGSGQKSIEARVGGGKPARAKKLGRHKGGKRLPCGVRLWRGRYSAIEIYIQHRAGGGYRPGVRHMHDVPPGNKVAGFLMTVVTVRRISIETVEKSKNFSQEVLENFQFRSCGGARNLR